MGDKKSDTTWRLTTFLENTLMVAMGEGRWGTDGLGVWD